MKKGADSTGKYLTSRRSVQISMTFQKYFLIAYDKKMTNLSGHSDQV